MLNRLGYANEITTDRQKIAKATRLILPGNGAFDSCMKNLRDTGLVPLLDEKVHQQKTPILGICVGAQMFGKSSEEGSESGLGWLDLRSIRFGSESDLPVPHMGWNTTAMTNTHPMFKDLSENPRYYFVHSYYLKPTDPSMILLSAKYGIDFAASVGRDNIVGVQFHPEKSHRFGKEILKSFAQFEAA